MSFIDKIAAALAPGEDADDRATARHNAEVHAGDNDWLAMVLDHHRAIEAGFTQLLSAGASASVADQRRLALLLTAHANAEESVIYPALTCYGHSDDAGMAYEEQALTKIEMAALEQLVPGSRPWADKLEQIFEALRHHVYEEEGTWFPALQQSLMPDDRALLTTRFREEFTRNCGAPIKAIPMPDSRSVSEHTA